MKLRKLALIISCAAAVTACGGGDDRTDKDPVPSPEVPETPENPDIPETPEEPSEPETPDEPGSQVESRPDPTADASKIAYNDKAVHDPSVIRTDDGTFYVVGSHLAMAKSTDLVSWEQVADGINPEDPNPDFASNGIFKNYATEVAEGIEWTGGYGGSWAADIIQLSDGRYYFYYNHCTNPASGECDAPRSYLGVAVSDEITGPYEDLGIFLRSGQTDTEIANGYGVGDMTSFDANIHPNTIDPDVFYDKDGKLWMTYGSYSGGIFVLKMDETTGKPIPGQGYGTHITGGAHSSIEGSYMLYSPESEYYYLFTSFGGFVSTDGYNIRISRSRSPNGPFVDAEGKDMINARGNWDSISPYGVKLMGGFNFESYPGDTAAARGYLAPGHNSAYYDEETGKHFLITHTRFPNRAESHAIRVHEMFVNEDGWLVASPQRYAPIEGENVVDSGDIVGDYKFINHEKDINRQAKQSLAITLTEDGEVTGALSGSYRLYPKQLNRITLNLDNLGTFEGITQWQWDEQNKRITPVFTALGTDGASIWGVQQPKSNNSEVLRAVTDALTYPETFKGDHLNLPTVGTRGTTITWSSDNPSVVTPSGRVLRPGVGEADQTVGLTAIAVRNGEESSTSTYVTIPARQPFNRIAQFDFEGDLSDALNNFGSGTVVGDRIYHLTSGDLSYAAGHNGQAVVFDGASGVLLPDGLISNYDYTVSFWINPSAFTDHTPAFFGAVNEQNPSNGNPFSNQWVSFLPQGWDGNTMLWSRIGTDAWLDGTANERVPANNWSHMAFSVNKGQLKVFLNGEEKYSGGQVPDLFTWADGKFALGVNYWDTPLQGSIDELKVYDASLTAGEVLALDVEKWATADLLNSAVELLDLGDISSLQSDLQLPIAGPYAASVSWTSSDPSVIAIEPGAGVVTRPPQGQGDVDVTLTATVTLDGQTATKDFIATVRSEGAPQPVAAFSFEESLVDARGNFSAGTVTGDRLSNTGGIVSYTEGVIGTALSLDGSSGVKLADNLITDASYTIEMWLNPTILTQFTAAFFGAATNSSWISVVPFGPGDGNTMLWSGTAWYDGDTGTQIPANVWTHLVAVNDSGNLTLYLNGEAVFNGANFPDIFSPAPNAQFGVGVNYWDTPYQGLIDELKIYDSPASAANVQAWYQKSAPAM